MCDTCRLNIGRLQITEHVANHAWEVYEAAEIKMASSAVNVQMSEPEVHVDTMQQEASTCTLPFARVVYTSTTVTIYPPAIGIPSAKAAEKWGGLAYSKWVTPDPTVVKGVKADDVDNDDMMTLSVRMSSGYRFKTIVRMKLIVHELIPFCVIKLVFAERFNISEPLFRVSYNGTQLHNNMSLRDNRVVDRSTLDLYIMTEM